MPPRDEDFDDFFPTEWEIDDSDWGIFGDEDWDENDDYELDIEWEPYDA